MPRPPRPTCFRLVATLAGLVLLSACAAGRTGHPPNTPDAPIAASAPEQAGLGLTLSWPERTAQALPAQVAAYRLTVSAADLTLPITATASRPVRAATSSIRVVVPAGAERTLTVEALDDAQRLLARCTRTHLLVAPGAFTAVQLALVNLVGELEGELLDAETGEPVADVTLTAGGATASSDARGHYRLTDLFPGPTVVTASGSLHESATFSVEVTGNVALEALPVALRPRHWFPQASGVSFHLTGVQAMSETEAWAWGANASALHTLDGGASWSVVVLSNDPALTVTGFHMGPDGHGVAALSYYGWRGALCRTVDGGQSWSGSVLSNTWYNSLAVVGGMLLVSGGDRGWPSVWSSTDEGQSWTPFPTGAYLGGSSNLLLAARTPLDVWQAAPNSSWLYRTTTGGVAGSTHELTPLIVDGAANSPFWVMPDGTVYLAGKRTDNYVDSKVVAVSRNGGASFDPAFVVPNLTRYYSGGFRAIGAWGQGLAAVGTEGIIAMWPGGDAPWYATSVTHPKSVDFNLGGVSFYDRRVGWAVGYNGQIVRY